MLIGQNGWRLIEQEIVLGWQQVAKNLCKRNEWYFSTNPHWRRHVESTSNCCSSSIRVSHSSSPSVRVTHFSSSSVRESHSSSSSAMVILSCSFQLIQMILVNNSIGFHNVLWTHICVCHFGKNVIWGNISSLKLWIACRIILFCQKNS